MARRNGGTPTVTHSRSMSCCSRLAPALLLHVNLLLAVYAGGALVTAARLKWDPSAYVAARELLPFEYRVSAVLLTAAAAMLLLLTHLVAVALASRHRRPLLITYATLMVVVAAAELSWAAWLAARLAAWLRSERALQLVEALQLRQSLRPLLEYLARWHPLPAKLTRLMEEVEADVPRNLWAASAAAGLLALLQPLAVVLALLVALRSPRVRRGSFSSASTESSLLPASAAAEPARVQRPVLRTAYRDGRIVVL